MTADALLPLLRSALAATRPEPHGLSGIPSAVLVPLFTRDGRLEVLYTKRSETLPHHQGQIAFPGGRHVAATDASLLVTALRESEEEIGVRPDDVEVLGELGAIHTFRSNFVIHPFVGIIPHPYVFRANAFEVSEIFSVPLDVLEDPATTVEEEWEFEGRRVPIAIYRQAGHTIWGATQRITASLLDVVAAIRATS